MRSWHRTYLYKWHLHLGLWVGVFFVMLGLTGSLLVFYPAVDSFLNPATHPKPGPRGDISVQRVYEALRVEHPDRVGSWRIELPMTSDQPIAARYYTAKETAHKKFAPLMVTIDPLTYAVTSSRLWGDYGVTWIYDLHYTLLADEWGHNAVGFVGVLLLISLVLGLALWMPTWRRIAYALKPRVRPQPVKKVYDLHMICGIYGGIWLALLALTGAMLSYPHVSKVAASTVLTFDPPMPSFRQLTVPTQPEVSLDELMQRSKSVFPSSEVRWIETSGEDGREVTLRLFNGPEPSRRFPQTYLKLHPTTGDVLYQRDYQKLPAGDKLWAWIHPMHNGEVMGISGRIFVAMLGLIPAILMVTGLMRHAHKRKARAGTSHNRLGR